MLTIKTARTILIENADDIYLAKQKGATNINILNALNDKSDIKITRQQLDYFIRKNIKKHLSSEFLSPEKKILNKKNQLIIKQLIQGILKQKS